MNTECSNCGTKCSRYVESRALKTKYCLTCHENSMEPVDCTRCGNIIMEQSTFGTDACRPELCDKCFFGPDYRPKPKRELCDYEFN
jgi:hypothetical protein